MSERSTIWLLALGAPRVRVDDGPVSLPPKRLAVFVYLALASQGGIVRRDSLLGIFWPESDEERARNALNQVVHHLRRTLGRDVIESRGDQELAVGEGVHTDVGRFEDELAVGDHEAALDLYSGDFLEGFHLVGAPEFERWLDGMQARLRRRARDAAALLAAAAEEAGRLPEAVGKLRRALDIDPSKEALARDLIRLLLAAGDRIAAQREYRRFARQLHTRLGLRPSEATRRMIAEAGLDPDARRPGPDIVSLSSPARRVASDLTDRASDLLEAGRAGNTAGRELLEQALRLDPKYAPAHAAYAQAICHWVQLFGGPWEGVGTALEAARRALELEPELPEAHFARAFSLETGGRSSEAARAYRRLLELRPHHVEGASHLGRNLQFSGDFVGALRWTEDRLQQSGPEPDLKFQLGMVHYCLGHDDEGEEHYRRTLEERPDFRWAQGSWIYFDFVKGRLDRAQHRADRMLETEPGGFIGLFATGDTRLALGDFEGAIRAYERCYGLGPDSRHSGILRATRTALGFAHLEGGDPAHGRALLTAAEREDRRALRAGVEFGGVHYDLASIHAARGEIEQAFSWLERAYRAGWLQHELLRVDPLLDSLRDDERLADIEAAMKRNVRRQRERLR